MPPSAIDVICTKCGAHAGSDCQTGAGAYTRPHARRRKVWTDWLVANRARLWRERHPKGTPVTAMISAWTDAKGHWHHTGPFETTVAGEAWALPQGAIVVRVEGYPNAVDVKHITVR